VAIWFVFAKLVAKTPAYCGQAQRKNSQDRRTTSRKP